MECQPVTRGLANRLALALFVLTVVIAGVIPATIAAQSGTDPQPEAASDAAQEPSPETLKEESADYQLRPGMNEFGVFVGGGPAISTFTGLLQSEAQDRYFIQTGFRYGRTFHVGETGALQYIVEATPLNLAFGNISAPDPAAPAVRRRNTAYGVGIAPIGIRYVFRPQKKVKVFAAVNLGMILFNEDVPVPGSSKFNFTTGIDAGAMIWSRNSRAVTLGMKFTHISNASTADLNPGVNSAVFYIGYSVFK